MTLLAVVCLVLLSVAGALLLVRLLRGPSVPDRVVALDGLLIVVLNGVALQAVLQKSEAFLRVLVVVALLGFVATVTAARFVERRGR